MADESTNFDHDRSFWVSANSRLQRDPNVGEIDAAEQQANRRHQHIADERSHDLAEGSANDHAYSQVNDVPPIHEIAEFLGDRHLTPSMHRHCHWSIE